EYFAGRFYSEIPEPGRVGADHDPGFAAARGEYDGRRRHRRLAGTHRRLCPQRRRLERKSLKLIVAGCGRGTGFLWKNNSPRSDIFFRQNTCTPPATGRFVSYSPWLKKSVHRSPFPGLIPTANLKHIVIVLRKVHRNPFLQILR